MQETRIFLFDIDGTLILTGGSADQALTDAFHQCFGRTIDLSQIHIPGVTDRGIARQMLEKNAVPVTAANETALLDAYLCLLETYLAEQRRGRILPGIEALLDRLLSSKDCAVALLTGNLERGARIKLLHYGLWDKFAFGAFADDSADRNELGPIAICRAGQILGIPILPEQCFVIGDTPRDILCGKIAHAKTIAVATGNYTVAELSVHSPDMVFQDFSDTEQVVSSLL